MKEATGEFSMTVVTIIAIIVIAGVIAVLKDPLTKFVRETFEGSTGAAVDRANEDAANN